MTSGETKFKIINIEGRSCSSFCVVNKNTDSVKNGITEYLWTETPWPVVSFTKFL